MIVLVRSSNISQKLDVIVGAYQLCFQPFTLLFQVVNHFHFGVLILSWNVLNETGFGGIVESRYVLFNVSIRR